MKHPFAYYINQYIEELDGLYAPITVAARRKRLIQFKNIFYEFYEEKKVSTISPRLLTVADILVFFKYRKERVSKETLQDDIAFLGGLLEFCNNGAVVEFKKKYRKFLPKTHHSPLPPLTNEEYNIILNHANSVPSDDWFRMRNYAVVLFSLCGGMRPLEIRNATIDNVLIEKGRMKVWLNVVKGMDTYGEQRWSYIHPSAFPFLSRYIEGRKQYLNVSKLERIGLIPNIGDEREFISEKTLIKLKNYVCEDVGFDFDIRKCRRTYAQRCVDEGIQPSDLQILMGHNDPKTTYDNYARKRPENVRNDVYKIWENSPKEDKGREGS